ncbi:TonB-dependent receptor plug domain-containing protein [Sphingomonas hengshuiensis]|uniref:TonB-dependent receptor n=1 Tax=Sphingomonas hengshuiensis TaxID=1609977 RepID=A0A7U4J6D8_9SPHN|nr:TonB-dependent receptor [Sphingomonas hengshuiensis]AJP71080.1 TonB-dependent receptor [Sphingomonas hengshuiensis]
MKTQFKMLMNAGLAALALGLAHGAQAQTAAAQQDAGETDTIQSSEEIVVQGGIGYRNHSDEAEPVLVYDNAYFQRFEPLTAGDALKRVPSVTFLSDVIESDGARLRGLDPGYTQVLINGQKVPGSNADRSFFLDRIPAELIKQVEIVRSSSARRTADAMAGTLNIVLRDGYQLDGGYVRGGGLLFDDGEVKPSFGAVYGGAVGPGRILLGANVQGRYNPKKKTSLRYKDSPENNADYAADDFDNREVQTDTRDGTDYAFNGSYTIDTDTTDFEVSAYYVRTDRTETERSFEYNTKTGSYGPLSKKGSEDPGLLSDNANVNEIDQYNYTISSKLEQEWALGETTLRLGYSRFLDKQYETEFEIKFDKKVPEFSGELTQTRIDDREFSVGLDHEIELNPSIDFVFGSFLQNKNRKSNITTAEQEPDLDNSIRSSWDQFTNNPTSLATAFDASEAAAGGVNTIREHRRDLFALVEGDSGPLKWEAGVRWENTSVRINDATVDAADATSKTDYNYLLPSASLKFALTSADRITLSGARTMRRPRFDYISPALLKGELGDNDLLGNPDLRPETAWGVDLGYEHRIGKTGVVGINVFYRSVQDLVELANTGDEGSEGEGTVVLQPRNMGDGKVYGVEFDLSSDLAVIGMANTGIFGNFSLLDSEITDDFGTRRFNDQSNFVFNVGFIQNLPSVGAAFGASYRKQGDAYGRMVGEEVTTSYGADLEVFVEKRIGKSITIRAVGSNLLDAKKNETFNKFNTIDDQTTRSFDEYELESEKAGPVFQLMARVAF